MSGGGGLNIDNMRKSSSRVCMLLMIMLDVSGYNFY